MAAGLLLFVAGILMAHLPRYMFLVYGLAWLVVRQSLGVIFCRRTRWLLCTNVLTGEDPDQGAVSGLRTVSSIAAL